MNMSDDEYNSLRKRAEKAAFGNYLTKKLDEQKATQDSSSSYGPDAYKPMEFKPITEAGYTAPSAPYGAPEQPASSASTGQYSYAPPSTADLYAQYRETGVVPYRYYAAGAPTRAGEADTLRQSMPSAFTQVAQSPQAKPKQNFSIWDLFMSGQGLPAGLGNGVSGDGIGRLFEALKGSGRK